MTDEHKPADYAELLRQLECGPHDQFMIEKAAVAISSLIWERDDTEAERAHHDIMSQSLRVDLDLMRQRAETAEARAAASGNPELSNPSKQCRTRSSRQLKKKGPTMNWKQHIVRQIAWSGATFGPGPRTAGVSDHIKKELVEVAEANGSPGEWTDVAILAMDGLWRAVRAHNPPNLDNDEIAALVVQHIVDKQNRNERRTWPDWRTMPADKAIEHVRS